MKLCLNLMENNLKTQFKLQNLAKIDLLCLRVCRRSIDGSIIIKWIWVTISGQFFFFFFFALTNDEDIEDD